MFVVVVPCQRQMKRRRGCHLFENILARIRGSKNSESDALTEDGPPDNERK